MGVVRESEVSFILGKTTGRVMTDRRELSPPQFPDTGEKAFVFIHVGRSR